MVKKLSNFRKFKKISEKSLKPASCATWLTRAQNPKKIPRKILKWAKIAIFWPKMVLFCTYGWFVPFSGWFSVQFYLGQFKLSRFLCGDFDFAIVAKNWHFFRVTLWYFFFYKIVVFLTLHQTRVRWVKRLENEFSGKWRALIGWL